MTEESELKKLKKNYAEIQKKYNLPEFEELNKDFSIEKISETQTDFLLREIRRLMADKFSNYLRFIESVLNPVNVPMFVFSVVKSIDSKNKEKLTEAYKKIAKIEVDLIEVDIEYSEEKEAKFILESYKIWNKLKPDILEFVNSVRKKWDNKYEKNGKNYFG